MGLQGGGGKEEMLYDSDSRINLFATGQAQAQALAQAQTQSELDTKNGLSFFSSGIPTRHAPPGTRARYPAPPPPLPLLLFFGPYTAK